MRQAPLAMPAVWEDANERKDVHSLALQLSRNATADITFKEMCGTRALPWAEGVYVTEAPWVDD